MPVTKIIHTEAELRAELEQIYSEFPTLRDFRPDCCGGCAEDQLAARHGGWGHPITCASGTE